MLPPAPPPPSSPTVDRAPLDDALDAYERLLAAKAEAEDAVRQINLLVSRARSMIAPMLAAANGLGWYRRRGVGYRPFRDLGGFLREKDKPRNPL
jgi:hypothetical protein